jgi:hypothetical protein
LLGIPTLSWPSSEAAIQANKFQLLKLETGWQGQARPSSGTKLANVFTASSGSGNIRVIKFAMAFSSARAMTTPISVRMV